MATRYVHCISAGFRVTERISRHEFFRQVCHFALGFVGSKILNHHRPLFVGDSRRERLARIVSGNSAREVGLAPDVGRLMGEVMYRKLLDEEVSLEELRGWFRNPFTRRRSAEGLYSRFDPFPKQPS